MKGWLFSRHQIKDRVNSQIDEHISIEKQKQEQKFEKGNFKLDKLPLPKFDGKIRSYAHFRRDFEDLVVPCLSS